MCSRSWTWTRAATWSRTNSSSVSIYTCMMYVVCIDVVCLRSVLCNLTSNCICIYVYLYMYYLITLHIYSINCPTHIGLSAINLAISDEKMGKTIYIYTYSNVYTYVLWSLYTLYQLQYICSYIFTHLYTSDEYLDIVDPHRDGVQVSYQ